MRGNLSYHYDVSADGQRILAVTPHENASEPLTLVQNWTDPDGRPSRRCGTAPLDGCEHSHVQPGEPCGGPVEIAGHASAPAVAPERKLVPLTVRLKAGPPAVAEFGERLEMLDGAEQVAFEPRARPSAERLPRVPRFPALG